MAQRFSVRGGPGARVSCCKRSLVVPIFNRPGYSSPKTGLSRPRGFQALAPRLPLGSRAERLDSAVRPAASYGGSGSNDPKDDLEVTVDAVRMLQGSHVVHLKIVGTDLLLPVHIGEAESNAITRELTKSKQSRPMTHDFAKTLLQACGFRVTKVRITELVSSTYFSRVHIGRNTRGSVAFVADVDARPSDAINLALRFGAPMYISKQVAENATAFLSETPSGRQMETPADIVRSVRSTLSSFEDPTIMFQLQKSLAIQHQRFEDAQMFQQRIYHEMTHNQLLRLVVAMEAALADNRYEEAARLRDEYKQMQSMLSSKNSSTEAAL